MALLDWEQAQQESFLRMQFNAQSAFYAQHFSAARFDLIEKAGEPIGRLIVHRRDDEIRIIDIVLLPHFRGQGIGTAQIQKIMGEGQRAGLPVRLHVQAHSPALRLYHRLGFTPISSNGLDWLMEWQPN